MTSHIKHFGLIGFLGFVLWGALSTSAAASTANITQLTDVTFSALDPTVNASRSQSVCIYTSTTNYSVTATGNGAASAFTLSAGGSVPTLPYGVAWSASTGQTSGTALTSGVPLASQSSFALVTTCALGLATSASLIVSLNSSDLEGAVSGVTYSGVLTLTIRPQ